MAHLIAGMIECHDGSRFDITAISLGPDDNSEMRQRLKASFGHFIDAKAFSDEQIADLIRSSEVDILVDLMGFTTHSRTGIFAMRPAPIQVNYLGYAGTMGAKYMDYIFADGVVIPEWEREHYSEKVVYHRRSPVTTWFVLSRVSSMNLAILVLLVMLRHSQLVMTPRRHCRSRARSPGADHPTLHA